MIATLVASRQEEEAQSQQPASEQKRWLLTSTDLRGSPPFPENRIVVDETNDRVGRT